MNRMMRFPFSTMFLLGLLLAGQAWAQDYETGRSAYISGDYARALSILRPLAEDGDPEAQKILGIMYDYGHGIEKDQQEALYWYIRSAEQGQPAVQYQVGAKYFRGEGTAQDYEEAADWWEMAANAGQVDAQFNLGLMYYRGLSLATDNARAAELFRQAAEQGHSYAQYSLAVMYSFGQGVDQDYSTALQWFTRSAEQGVAQAQFNMGVYYENGYGVDVDLDQARSWYERASAQGLQEATAKLGLLAESQSPPQPRQQAEPTPIPVPIEPVIAENNIEPAPATPMRVAEAGGIKREAWVQSQSPDSYTLQIGSVLNEQDIVKFIEQSGLQGDTAYIEVIIDGVRRYNAVYGVYVNYSQANDAINSLPRSIRNIKPWVRNFGILQNMLNEIR